MKITADKIKIKLEQDFGWSNLYSEDKKWFVDNLIKDTIEAINVINSCETLKGKEELTIDEYLADYKKDSKIYQDYTSEEVNGISDFINGYIETKQKL